jgi:hypothetical protein
MTLEEYKNSVNGKQVEEGGSSDALYQCVDAVNGYISKVLGLPKILGTNAKDFITKGVASGNFEKVSTAQVGDIAVWNWGDYGHIAIYLGNGQYLTQNYPLTQRTTIATLNTNGLIGYMRKKGGLVNQAEIEANLQGLNNFNNLQIKQIAELQKKVKTLEAQKAGVVTEEQILNAIKNALK